MAEQSKGKKTAPTAIMMALEELPAGRALREKVLEGDVTMDRLKEVLIPGLPDVPGGKRNTLQQFLPRLG